MIDKLIDILKDAQDEDSYFIPSEFEDGYGGNAVKYVDEVQLGEGRWSAHMLTIVKFDDRLWGIEWSRGLTENQENEFYPDKDSVFEVDKTEKVVYSYTKKSS